MNRLKDRLKFILERWIQRGAWHQLLVMVAAVVLVAVTGGLLAWGLTEGFEDPGVAIWWAFLRLTDPGYLGDDEGTLLRGISTTITVLGYVLFMGSLIAILTQSLARTMRTLESGLTPIYISGHLLILGWTNRTPTIVRELVISEGRVRRFLSGRKTRRLRIVILTEEVDAKIRQELRDVLGSSLKRSQIIFRSGSSMRIEHLRRVDFTNAAAILLPGADFELGGAAATDTRIIKTLMSIAKYSQLPNRQQPPVVVAEIFDTQKLPIARQAYAGELNLVAGDAFIGRLIAQTVRHRGLSHVYGELLSYQHGNEVYLRNHPELAGQPFWSLMDTFPKAVLLGVVRPENTTFQPFLNPPSGFKLTAEDRLVFVASDYEDGDLEDVKTAGTFAAEQPALLDAPLQPQRRLLFLGWSHKVPAIIHEFSSYANERFEIDVLSVVPAAERNEVMTRFDSDPDRVQVRQLEGDYTIQADLLAANPSSYDNLIFLGSDWAASGEAADARTILGYVLLRATLPPDYPTEILVELIDPSNARLFQQRPGEVIISPLILSHMLAHAALRPELPVVFEELFGPGGAEIFFRTAADYHLTGASVGFQDLQHHAAQHGEIALGLRLAATADRVDGGVHLNPSRLQRWTLNAADEIVVLTTYG
jgi:hypothetical protein